MSERPIRGTFYRPKFYDEVNNTLTASTDVITQFGTVRICWHEETVINVVIGTFEPEERRVTLRRFMPPHPEGQALIGDFIRYFSGKPTAFEVPLPPEIGSDFQRAIWASLREIEPGTYQTYGEFALRLGLSVSRARNIGSIIAQNPLPIIFPCHRVVAATGALTGYAAGPKWKKALLEHEGVPVHNDRVKVQSPPSP